MLDTTVRKYREGDKEAIQDICYLTGYMGNSAEAFWRHKPSFVALWTAYYIHQEPESLLVAIFEGSVVGYLTGCVDTSKAPKSEEVYNFLIKKYNLLFRPGTAGFFYRGIVDNIWDKIKGHETAKGEFIDERWPSHLHINLLPVARGKGLGRALMERWLEQLEQIGSPGCHVSTLVENTNAMLFFQKMGFVKHKKPTLIPGIRGPKGERLHQQIMVHSI